MSTNKKRGVIKRIHPITNLRFVIDYFFSASWWIANLGVVPWLRFLALRRAPIFLWRRLRLFSVTLVLETISQLRHLQRYTLTKGSHFLPLRRCHVKRFVLLAAILPFFLSIAHGQSQSLFIAIGEHSELKVPNLKEYSVSNSDTLSHKYRPSQKSLLIRGKRKGHAEVVVWNTNGPKSIWNIYVLSKAKHLKWMETLKALADLGLETKARGRLVRITGSLAEISEWHAFRSLALELEKQSELTFINEVIAETELKKLLLTDIYHSFFVLHADGVDCKKEKLGPWTTCLLPMEIRERKEIQQLLTTLEANHFIRIENTLESANLSNYKLTIHLYKLEQRNAMETDLTLERAAGSLSQLNRKDLLALVRGDDFVLGETRFKLNTIADPEIIIRPGKDFEIQMGSDIPYQSQNSDNNSTTLFRFAGLKVTGLLSRSPLGNIIDYQIELSSPAAEGAITGNKKSSSILITDGVEMNAFKLQYINQGLDQSSLPFVSRIPVLGSLFSDTQQSHEEKLIIGTITLERM